MLIHQGRFADLINYTQIRQSRFGREATLLIEHVTHNSPWTFLLKAASVGVVPMFATAIDGVVQIRQRWRGKVLENDEREARIRREEEEARSKRADEALERQLRETQAFLDQARAAQQAALELQKAKELFELERQKKEIELTRERLLLQAERKKQALLNERLEIQLTLTKTTRELARQTIRQTRPQLETSISEALAETLVPTMLQLISHEEEWEAEVIALDPPSEQSKPD